MSCDTNLNANNKALATKYSVTASELTRVTQARMVWDWFLNTLNFARDWAQGLTTTRDLMTSAPQAATQPLPGGPMMPAVPLMPQTQQPAQLEPGFFIFFSALVARIKANENYDPADGLLLGIEGAAMPAPDPAILPKLSGDLFTSGHPELTCVKGQFQGYDVYLTRPGQARKLIGFSMSRRYNVTEPLPAPGTAEVWMFEVQYRYQNAPFGQLSQPLNLTVRG